MSEQVKDISPIMAKSLMVMIATWGFDYLIGQNFETHPLVRILMNSTVFALLYFIIAYYGKSTAFVDFLDLAKQSKLYKQFYPIKMDKVDS